MNVVELYIEEIEVFDVTHYETHDNSEAAAEVRDLMLGYDKLHTMKLQLSS